MDSKQFDELVARLADGTSRRDALKGIAGGALAAVGVTAVADAKGKKGKGRAGAAAKKRATAEACIPTGKRCPAKRPRGKKKGKVLGCNKCCQGFVDSSSGKNRCACTPDTVSCKDDAQCCSGSCQSGKCQTYGYGG